MRCPSCGKGKFLTENTRSNPAGITRMKECRNCGHTFPSIEIPRRKYDALVAKIEKYERSLAALSDALHEASK